MTTITLQNADGTTSPVMGTGTLVISGQKIVVQGRAMPDPAQAVDQVPAAPVNPGQP